jgi:hypothetical protein
MDSIVAAARKGGEASCEGTAISLVIVTEMRNRSGDLDEAETTLAPQAILERAGFQAILAATKLRWRGWTRSGCFFVSLITP